MRVTCPICRGNHPKWDCKSPASKTTNSAKAVRSAGSPADLTSGTSGPASSKTPDEAARVAETSVEVAWSLPSGGINGDLGSATVAQEDSVALGLRPANATANRNKSRHRPGYFTEYMRDYRKGIRRRKTDD